MSDNGADLDQQELDCPLSDAPGCFRRALIRALELGGSTNYLPTNWQGFAEYFSLEDSASSPKGLVNHWADEHPNHKQHTIRKVLEYAEAKQHNALLQDFNKILEGEIINSGAYQGCKHFRHSVNSCFWWCSMSVL